MRLNCVRHACILRALVCTSSSTSSYYYYYLRGTNTRHSHTNAAALRIHTCTHSQNIRTIVRLRLVILIEFVGVRVCVWCACTLFMRESLSAWRSGARVCAVEQCFSGYELLCARQNGSSDKCNTRSRVCVR